MTMVESWEPPRRPRGSGPTATTLAGRNVEETDADFKGHVVTEIGNLFYS
jgi:hypothetical protein